MSRTMLALGAFRFSMDTAAYQQLQRTNAWRWPSVERIGRPAALQYVGPNLTELSLSGTVYPSFRGGLGQLDAMRAEADKGEPLLLVAGTGLVWGRYVITGLTEGQRYFFDDGTPRRLDFDLTLSEYGDDV